MFHDRPRPGSWKLSKAELDQTIAALLKLSPIDHKHDVPYTAGAAKNGPEIFIDRTLPDELRYKGRVIVVKRYILLHEDVEKALMTYLGLAYLHAHQIALRAEQSAVEADGHDWVDYNTVIMREVTRIGNKPGYPCCPKNLDLQPYKDEKDTKTLDRMETMPPSSR